MSNYYDRLGETNAALQLGAASLRSPSRAAAIAAAQARIKPVVAANRAWLNSAEASQYSEAQITALSSATADLDAFTLINPLAGDSAVERIERALQDAAGKAGTGVEIGIVIVCVAIAILILK